MFNFIDWGVIDYNEALKNQEALFNLKIEQKIAGKQPTQDLILCEHLPVYTIGKHGDDNNMLMSDKWLKENNIKLIHISRGGDITYHGPGQITGYPILDLQQLHLGLKDYIHQIEEAVIITIANYGIIGSRLTDATGVWIDPLGSNARKICAIGVRASRYVTMHGFALNVNTDLRYFSYINPCGFSDKAVTSIQKEIGTCVPINQVKQELLSNISKCLSLKRNKDTFI